MNSGKNASYLAAAESTVSDEAVIDFGPGYDTIIDNDALSKMGKDCILLIAFGGCCNYSGASIIVDVTSVLLPLQNYKYNSTLIPPFSFLW